MLNMPAFLLRKKMIIEKLKACGSFSEETAKTLEEVGVFNPKAFPKVTEDLEMQGILARSKDGKHYLIKERCRHK